MCFKHFISLIIFSLLLSNCYEAKKGCLDTEAVNFDAGADDTCCCVYPKLMLNVAQNFNDSVYLPNKIYEWETGKFLRIKSIVFFLSDFSFTRNTVVFTPTDSLDFKLWPDSTVERLPNDFAQIKRETGDYPIGTLQESGDFDGFSFTFGLNEVDNKIIITKIKSASDLKQQKEKLWLNEIDGFAFARIELQQDTLIDTPIDTFYLSRPDFQKIPFNFPGDFKHKSGYNFEIKLKVDFKKWFEGTNLPTTDISALKTKIMSNLSSSFDVSQ
jgi:hypothetical protein